MSKYAYLRLTILFLLPATVFPDGAVFVWHNRKRDIEQPDQKVVIFWDGAKERMVLQTKYKGPAEELVWIVPVPGEPEVKKGDLQVFKDFSQRTQEPDLSYYYGVRYYGSKGGGGRGDIVKWRRRIGVYDVVLLSPDGGEKATAWLNSNGYSVSERAAKLIEEYVQKKWWMICSKIHREALGAQTRNRLVSGTIHPLDITFATKRCIYPLKLTSLAAGPVEELIYIQAPHHYEPATLKSRHWYIDVYGGPGSHYYIRDSQGNLHRSFSFNPSSWPDHFTLVFSEENCVTRLRRVFKPEEMEDDLVLQKLDYARFFVPQTPPGPEPYDPTRRRNADPLPEYTEYNRLRIAQGATQYGRHRDPEGIPHLIKVLCTEPVTGERYICSAIWALGEIGEKHPGNPAVEKALLQCVKAGSSTEGLAWQALKKAVPGRVELLLFSALQKMKKYNKCSFCSFENKRALSLYEKWFEGNEGSRLHDRYSAFIRQLLIEANDTMKNRIVRIADRELRYRKGMYDDLFSDAGPHLGWLTKRVAILKDQQLMKPLQDLMTSCINVVRLYAETGYVDWSRDAGRFGTLIPAMEKAVRLCSTNGNAAFQARYLALVRDLLTKVHPVMKEHLACLPEVTDLEKRQDQIRKVFSDLSRSLQWMLDAAYEIKDPQLGEALAPIRDLFHEYRSALSFYPYGSYLKRLYLKLLFVEKQCGSGEVGSKLCEQVYAIVNIPLKRKLPADGFLKLRSRILQRRKFIPVSFETFTFPSSKSVRDKKNQEIWEAVIRHVFASDSPDEWCALYLLSCIENPTFVDAVELVQLWVNGKWDNSPMKQILAVDVAYCWRDKELLLSFVDDDVPAAVTSEIVWALAAMRAPEAAPFLEKEILDRWGPALNESRKVVTWRDLTPVFSRSFLNTSLYRNCPKDIKHFIHYLTYEALEKNRSHCDKRKLVEKIAMHSDAEVWLRFCFAVCWYMDDAIRNNVLEEIAPKLLKQCATIDAFDAVAGELPRNVLKKMLSRTDAIRRQIVLLKYLLKKRHPDDFPFIRHVLEEKWPKRYEASQGEDFPGKGYGSLIMRLHSYADENEQVIPLFVQLLNRSSLPLGYRIFLAKSLRFTLDERFIDSIQKLLQEPLSEGDRKALQEEFSWQKRALD